MSLYESTLDMEESLPASADDAPLTGSASPKTGCEGGAAAHGHEPQLTVIQARPGWQIIDFAEIWRFRELLYFLVSRDVKVRYKQTVLGAAWAVLQPFSQMVVFSIFFGRMAEVSSGGLPYPLFAFAGLLPWMLFANSITAASQSVVANQNMITKVYFPRLFIPATVIGAALVDFVIAFGMLLLLMAYYGAVPGFAILLAPLIALGLTAAAFGVGALLSALTVSYRDFRYVVPFMVQLWMFATPTVYMDVSVVGPRWRILLPFNPIYGLIQNFRSAVLGQQLDWYTLMVSLGTTALIFFVGCLYFRKMERTFADII